MFSLVVVVVAIGVIEVASGCCCCSMIVAVDGIGNVVLAVVVLVVDVVVVEDGLPRLEGDLDRPRHVHGVLGWVQCAGLGALFGRTRDLVRAGDDVEARVFAEGAVVSSSLGCK